MTRARGVRELQIGLFVLATIAAFVVVLERGRATDGDPASADCAYSWDTHNATCVIHLGNADGSGRSGISIGHWLWHVESRTNITPLPSITEQGTGNYWMSVNLGTSPQLGTYNYTIQAPNTGILAPVSASAVFSVPDNLTLRLQDLSALVSSLYASMNNSFADHEQNESARWNYTLALINQTALPNGTAPTILINASCETTPPPGCFVSKPAHFSANASWNGVYGPILWVWDYGDNHTGEGPAPHHEYERAGTYNVTVFVWNALGQQGNATMNVTVVVSTPVAVIDPVPNLTALQRYTFEGVHSYDPHDTIVKYAWELDGADAQNIPVLGNMRISAGVGSNHDFNYVFPASGANHTLRLTVTNAHGATNTTLVIVNVTQTAFWPVPTNTSGSPEVVPPSDWSGPASVPQKIINGVVWLGRLLFGVG